MGPVTARLCDLATLLIGVIPRLWRRRSAGFHVRDRSLLTFCPVGHRLLSSGRRPGRRIPKLGLSTKYVFCKKSARCVSLDSAESGVECPDGQNAQLRGHYPEYARSFRLRRARARLESRARCSPTPGCDIPELKAIFTAASKASEAVGFLASLQGA